MKKIIDLYPLGNEFFLFHNKRSPLINFQMAEANFMTSIIFWAEMFVAFSLIIVMFFALVYYMSHFVEERMIPFVKMVKFYALIVFFTSLLIPLSGFSIYTFISCGAENLLWFLVLNDGFPYISLKRLDFILAGVFTICSHIAWMFDFVNIETTGFVALCTYLFMVWGVPLLVLASLVVTDDAGDVTASRQIKTKSIWSNALNKCIAFARSLLPHSSDKFD